MSIANQNQYKLRNSSPLTRGRSREMQNPDSKQRNDFGPKPKKRPLNPADERSNQYQTKAKNLYQMSVPSLEGDCKWTPAVQGDSTVDPALLNGQYNYQCEPTHWSPTPEKYKGRSVSPSIYALDDDEEDSPNKVQRGNQIRLQLRLISLSFSVKEHTPVSVIFEIPHLKVRHETQNYHALDRLIYKIKLNESFQNLLEADKIYPQNNNNHYNVVQDHWLQSQESFGFKNQNLKQNNCPLMSNVSVVMEKGDKRGQACFLGTTSFDMEKFICHNDERMNVSKFQLFDPETGREIPNGCIEIGWRLNPIMNAQPNKPNSGEEYAPSTGARTAAYTYATPEKVSDQQNPQVLQYKAQIRDQAQKNKEMMLKLEFTLGEQIKKMLALQKKLEIDKKKLVHQTKLADDNEIYLGNLKDEHGKLQKDISQVRVDMKELKLKKKSQSQVQFRSSGGLRIQEQVQPAAPMYDLRKYLINIRNHDVDYLDSAWEYTDMNVRRINW